MTLRVKAALLAGILLLVMSAIGFTLFAQDKPIDGRATLAVGVIVAATSGSSVIYQIDRWRLRKQSLVHFVIMCLTVLPALLLSGWFPLQDAWGYLTVVGVFLSTGLILWLALYLIFTTLVPRRSADAGRIDVR
ncbi:DUF3021 domain-containing protein [Microbacterium sp. cf332]|uniref:DUF3021 domain-containing protein n=1 Tax=Microbacterium sp. cf332 TaxID=1761804 RepID=UPI000882D735|nr:DUF3021 domain-containing protein [Microbacterium sp. cf332]SDQ13172.1 Protein of unknown function [Microbacterium sp. cf332]